MPDGRDRHHVSAHRQRPVIGAHPARWSSTFIVVDAPETVTEAVRGLQQRGYGDDFTIAPAGVHCAACGGVHPARRLVITDVFRFEGPSDPGDETIVLGVECPACGERGIVVSAFGPDADDQLRDLVEVTLRGREATEQPPRR
jgi:hypothetical protein